MPELAGAAFVGHIMTDLDSVAGAIGAAHLYGGDPAIASEINTETEFALKEWGCALPATIETTPSGTRAETCAWWISSSSRSSTR